MRVDVHNHAIPEQALDLIRAEPAYGVRVEDHHWVGGSNPRRFEIAASFVDPEAKSAELDANELDGAVISPAPPLFFYDVAGDAGEAIARATNAGLAAFCRAQPERLRWMAGVCLQDVGRAVAVLDDAVAAGCCGLEIGTATPNARLDDPDLEPFWQAAERNSLPVMIHPAYNEHNPSLESFYLQNVIGNQLETTVAVERLICAGVLDRHPGLRVLLAHAGGYFPWQAGRLRHARTVRPELANAPADPWQYLKQLWFDSVTHDRAALSYLVTRVGADRVVLGTDLPFDMAMPAAVEELRQAAGPKAAVKVAEENAATLFAQTAAPAGRGG